jgi:hypothetical protein
MALVSMATSFFVVLLFFGIIFTVIGFAGSAGSLVGGLIMLAIGGFGLFRRRRAA